MRIFDLHCDTLFKVFEDTKYSLADNDGHISEKGLLKGRYLAQCFAIYQPTDIIGNDGFDFFKKQCNVFENVVKSSSVLSLARSNSDIRENLANGRVSAVLTVENADFLQNDLRRLETVMQKKVRILGLVHNSENCLGHPHSADPKYDLLPLKGFGCEVVDALNGTDVAVDVSHLNQGGFWSVVRVSKRPIVATHSCCRSLFEHSRNLYDNQIKAIAESGGVVGCVFYSYFLNGTDRTEVDDIIRHLKHLIKVGGEDVVALGTDFDGMECDLEVKTASDMQILADRIVKELGFSTAEKICYKNAMRII